MIYRKVNGDLIIIDKLNFKSDKLFYEKIMELAKEYETIGNNIHINTPKNSRDYSDSSITNLLNKLS